MRCSKVTTSSTPWCPSPNSRAARAAGPTGGDMRSLSKLKHVTLYSIALPAFFACSAQAVERVAPQVDTSALPPQAQTWQEPNPLRGHVQAAAIGQQAFQQSCARCHGDNANGARAP